MIGSRLEIVNLMKICALDIKRKCIDDSEKVRKEIMIKLLDTNRIIGIIANSDLYVSSIELYQMKNNIAISFGYLSLRYRENNRLLYFFSKNVNSVTSGKEINYSDPVNAANSIITDFLNEFCYTT